MTYFNRNHENWAAVADKVVGDTVQLVVQPRHYDGGDEFLAEGTITKATAATRCFTMDGAQREGEIQNRANMRYPREISGSVKVGEDRFGFKIATPVDVARITDPLREKKDAVTESLRDLRFSRQHETAAHLDSLIADLNAALGAAKALRSEL